MVLVALNVALASQVWARGITKKDISMLFSSSSFLGGPVSFSGFRIPEVTLTGTEILLI
jgi:hypothetical protein